MYKRQHIGKRATDKSLELAASKMRLSDSKELLARVGSTEVRPGHVVRLVHPEVTSADDFDVDQASAVIGLHEGQFLDRRPCCGPLPGERIVGIASGGSGVAIHAIDCPALVRFEDKPELWIDLHWHAGKHAAVYPTSIEITISNDAGVVGRVCTIIGEMGANISDLAFVDRKPDFYKIEIAVELNGIEHLHSLLTRLEAEGEVASIKRRRGYKQENAPHN